MKCRVDFASLMLHCFLLSVLLLSFPADAEVRFFIRPTEVLFGCTDVALYRLKPEIVPESIAVGDYFVVDIFGGKYFDRGDNNEYTYGECGYGYEWTDCMAGVCTHGDQYGLDADACNIANSFYVRHRILGINCVSPDYIYSITGAYRAVFHACRRDCPIVVFKQQSEVL